MKYLLDVNVLVALGIFHHKFHNRVIAWTTSQKSAQLHSTGLTPPAKGV